VSTQVTPDTPATREPVLGLLQTFAAQPHCDKYAGDSKKIDLILTYLWLRQLTPELPFETFLEKFAAVADHDEQNRKYPEDALKHHCPRSKKTADAANVEQWTAKECVEILSVYVDMVREAERQGAAVPMTLDEYLAMDGPEYKKGNVEILHPEKKPRGRQARASTAPTMADPETGLVPTTTPTRPSGAGQRVIYEPPNQGGRQIKGTTEAVSSATVGEETRQYVTFHTDEGELFQDVSIMHCVLADEEVPAIAEAAEKQVLWIPKVDYAKAVVALQLDQPMGNVPMDTAIYQFAIAFTTVQAAVQINVVNGETGPYVEAQLYDPKTNDLIGSTLPPRQNLLGSYRFATSAGILEVVVRARDTVS